MTYRVYGQERSGSAIVELALAELGVPYECVRISLEAAEQRRAEYAAINPERKLPTLVAPGGEILTESLAILLTLNERFPVAELLPSFATLAGARALRWLTFVATELYPVVEIVDYPERFAPAGGDVEEVRAIAKNLRRKRWLIVERQVEGDPYFLAEGFSGIDIYIAVVSRWGQQEDWRPQNLPRIEKLTAAVAERPALGALWRRHFSPD